MKLATRVKFLTSSAIREAGKRIAAKENCISFAGGLPSPEYIPVEEVRQITHQLLGKEGKVALQYGPTKGYPALIQKIVEKTRREHGSCEVDNIQITTGSQQAIYFSAMMFCDKGDTILVENPTYLGALASFRPFEVNVKGIDVDEEGMKIEKLEEVIKNDPNVKMIYVVPNFSNPTGRTWSYQRRVDLYNIAQKYDLPIIEDDPYGEIRFEGESLPSIKSLDIDDRVLYLGSFSKVFCAGMRVGWICADKEFIEKIEIMKQGVDLQSNQLAQMQVNSYLDHYDINDQIQAIIRGYREKRNLMCSLIDEFLPPSVKRTNPEGGMFVWLELPQEYDANQLLEKALEKNVGFVPGGSFFPQGGHENTIRLNYSYVDEKEIVEGIKVLGELFYEEFGN